MKKVTQKKAVMWLAYFLLVVLFSVLVPDENLLFLGSVILLVMILPANYFPIFYTIAFRWWNGHLGRALFTKALGLAIILDAAMLFKYFGETSWAEEIRFTAYVLVLTGMFYQSIVMTQIRVKAGHNKPKATPSKDLPGVDIH